MASVQASYLQFLLRRSKASEKPRSVSNFIGAVQRSFRCSRHSLDSTHPATPDDPLAPDAIPTVIEFVDIFWMLPLYANETGALDPREADETDARWIQFGISVDPTQLQDEDTLQPFSGGPTAARRTITPCEGTCECAYLSVFRARKRALGGSQGWLLQSDDSKRRRSKKLGKTK